MAKQRSRSALQIPLWEWIFAAIGLVLVASTVAFIAYRAITGGNRPPEITVRAETVVPLQSGYLVTIAAHNAGARTAASVKVEGELRKGDAAVEKSETTLQYVPMRSTRRGGLYFTQDPRRFELVLSARGYERP